MIYYTFTDNSKKTTNFLYIWCTTICVWLPPETAHDNANQLKNNFLSLDAAAGWSVCLCPLVCESVVQQAASAPCCTYLVNRNEFLSVVQHWKQQIQFICFFQLTIRQNYRLCFLLLSVCHFFFYRFVFPLLFYVVIIQTLLNRCLLQTKT